MSFINLNLFENALLEVLTQQLGSNIRITLTDNRRTIVSLRKASGLIHLRVSRIFALCGRETWEALIRYIKGDIARLPRHVISSIEQSTLSQKNRMDSLSCIRTKGNVYDLREVARRLNHEYFDGRLHVNITWGRRRLSRQKRRRRRSIQFGSYDHELDLIRIHPALDRDLIPLNFLEWIVYHEMLHKRIGITRHADGRRRIHTPEFRNQEQNFRDYEEVIEWEKQNLEKLLRI